MSQTLGVVEQVHVVGNERRRGLAWHCVRGHTKGHAKTGDSDQLRVGVGGITGVIIAN